ncbi:antitoxin [Proteus mirabilis]|uniref:AbrB/MazE/SpoVT family DNA-binding domain-containing protein n=1 Tax=Proteus mirabilis TaxID=584 RepID=UPI0034E3D44B
MAITKLRQQGGAVVMTIPSEILAAKGWLAGMEMKIDSIGDGITTMPVKRVPRGRKRVSEILADVDSNEIKKLNEQLGDNISVGRELI